MIKKETADQELAQICLRILKEAETARSRKALATQDLFFPPYGNKVMTWIFGGGEDEQRR